jgi:CheY-like chemotaxis protein
MVLSVYHLPSFNGMEALKIVRQKNPDLPFILVSGTIGEQAAIESLKAGATILSGFETGLTDLKEPKWLIDQSKFSFKCIKRTIIKVLSDSDKGLSGYGQGLLNV